jgi:microcystin-dependent protein
MSQPYIGEIRMFAGNFPPNGWAFCDGQPMPIAENDVLFNLIGTTYGGDGEETFNLPNLQSRVPIHMGTGPDGTTYQIGEMAGTEQETLSVQQIPSHTHALAAVAGVANFADPINHVPAEADIDAYAPPGTVANLLATAVGPTGGSQPHENMAPFLCINFIISLFGVFPSQT